MNSLLLVISMFYSNNTHAQAVDADTALKGIRSDIKQAEFKKAYESLQNGDILNGIPLTKAFCDVAYDRPLQAGCSALEGKVKSIGADKFNVTQLSADRDKWNSTTAYIGSMQNYQTAKAFVAEMKKKYGPFAAFDKEDRELDAKLPALKAQSKKDLDAKAAEDKQKSDGERDKKAAQAATSARIAKMNERVRQQAERENTPQCKAARKKDEYCSALLKAERYQIIIDEQKEVTAASGTVRPGVMNDLANSKRLAVKESTFLASEYAEMTGSKLSGDDCKVVRKPGRQRDQAFLEEKIAKGLEEAILQYCGAK